MPTPESVSLDANVCQGEAVVAALNSGVPDIPVPDMVRARERAIALFDQMASHSCSIRVEVFLLADDLAEALCVERPTFLVRRYI